mmetsp:Transcript_3011/g.6106  ORF Transcript_3011/g.6106 Transcript_3011/m.6106 type:complete len:825 (+) Transcript_3011:172-2646(+)
MAIYGTSTRLPEACSMFNVVSKNTGTNIDDLLTFSTQESHVNETSRRWVNLTKTISSESNTHSIKGVGAKTSGEFFPVNVGIIRIPIDGDLQNSYRKCTSQNESDGYERFYCLNIQNEAQATTEKKCRNSEKVEGTQTSAPQNTIPEAHVKFIDESGNADQQLSSNLADINITDPIKSEIAVSLSENEILLELMKNEGIITWILDSSFHALFVINKEYIIQRINKESCDVFGWNKEEFIGKNISMIMAEKNATDHDNYVKNYVETGIKKIMGTQREVIARRKDGSTFPCVMGLSECGKSGLICGFIRDLTHDKASNATLVWKNAEVVANRNLIMSIMDASFHAIFVIDRKCIIQMVNAKSCEVFGWTKEELIGQNIKIIMPPAIANHHDGYMKSYLETGMKKMIGTQREVTAQRKDGSTFPCKLGLSETKESGLICGFIHDLTTEKAAEAELLAKTRLTEKIINASFDAMFVINERGVIEMVNAASEKVFGWSHDEFIGQNIKMIMPMSRAVNHDSYLKKYMESGVKKMIGTEREVEARRVDGSTFPCILGMSEVDNGDSRQFVGFVKDITDQKKKLHLAESERDASDALLYNILPEHIANRLKEDPSHIADLYGNTTILFADIVGFTDRTSLMSPQELVVMLNDIFSRFDDLIDIYELNKVKTIGDCYMVTSIPCNELEHDGCSRVCRFALDMMKAVQAFNNTGPRHGHITFRVGIATGQVVAGVVGTKRFLFDMWGDAVNVAARMEQSGLAGQIQVTKEVVESAGPDFTFERRGTLSIKGKGKMEVFILKSAHELNRKHSALDGRKPNSSRALRSASMIDNF